MGLPLVSRGKVFLLAGVVVALVGVACTPQRELVDPLEQRAQALDKALMCPICPGESIDQSQVELARQMRAVVREKLLEGLTDTEIKEYFVNNYRDSLGGPAVLMEPPREGFHLVAWIVPPIGVIIAILALFLVLRHLVRTDPASWHEGLEAVPDEEQQEYLYRVEEALKEQKRMDSSEL